MVRVAKSSIALKREYWSRPEMYFTPKMIDGLIARYGEKPATSGEAIYVLRERLLDLMSVLPLIGKCVR